MTQRRKEAKTQRKKRILNEVYRILDQPQTRFCLFLPLRLCLFTSLRQKSRKTLLSRYYKSAKPFISRQLREINQTLREKGPKIVAGKNFIFFAKNNLAAKPQYIVIFGIDSHLSWAYTLAVRSNFAATRTTLPQFCLMFTPGQTYLPNAAIYLPMQRGNGCRDWSGGWGPS